MNPDGTPEMFTQHGHETFVDDERSRVECRECPWFAWMPGEKSADMKRAGWSHRDATKLR